MIQFYTTDSSRYPIFSQVSAAIAGGCRWINLCEDVASSRVLKETLEEIIPICRDADAFLVVDDDVELVKESRVHGVRITKSDLSAAQARQELGPHAIIGVAVSSPADVASLKGVDVDYVTVDVASLAKIAPLAAAMQIPVVATGGVTLENCSSLLSAGAQGLGLSSAVVNSPDPQTYIECVIRTLCQN